MEHIRLKDFVAKVLAEGANLKGCIIQCGKHHYKFTGLDSRGRVEILYGEHDTPSHLNDWINVYRCYQSNVKKKNPRVGGGRILILDCTNPHLRS